jgi:hypothetical protein
MISGWKVKATNFFCWSASARKHVILKLIHWSVSERLAFLFAFQIESFPVVAGALRSPAGRLFDVQPWAEAHG